MKTDGLIDNRNIDLWNTLSKEFEIDIARTEQGNYSVYTKSGKATIFIPTNKVNCASFTHELLHIYMKKKDVFVGGGLKLHVMADEGVLSKFMSDYLIEHIGNSLEHIKMLPEFFKMGFDREDFISDYWTNKLSEDDLKLIKKHFRKKRLFERETFNSKVIDFYIGKCFAAKACPNQTYNYEKGLNELKLIDTDLYTVLQKFIRGWDKFDFDDTDPLTGGYHDILFDFITGLTEWGIKKRIV